MNRVGVVALLLAGILLAAGPAMQAQPVGKVRVDYLPAGVPQHMNLQGYLTDTAGNPINGSKSMRFDIYRGGSSVWDETQTVNVDKGLFSVVMGSSTVIPFSVFEPGTACSLQVTIEGDALPKVEITSVGFAYRSVKSDTAAYALSGQAQQYVDSARVAAGSHRVQGKDTTAFVRTGQAASGDLTDSYPNPTVAKLRGRTVSVTAPQVGQVLKWTTGNQWAPGNDSVGGGGSGVTSISQGTGITCSPNPITSTGTVSFNTSYTVPNADMVDNQHASAFAPLNHSHTNYVQKGGDTMTGALQMKGSRLELRRSNNTRYGWLDASSAGTYWRLYCDDAYAYFESDEHTGSDWIMEINDLTGEVRCHYDFTVLGSKDFAHPHPTDASKEIRYTALEGGEAGTYVRGTGQLTDGICVITIPEHFGLVTSPAGLTSQVTPRSDCAGLYVVSVTPQQLSVRELQNGTSDAAFDWVVQGVRIGQENKQVIRDKPARPYPKDGFSLGSRRD